MKPSLLFCIALAACIPLTGVAEIRGARPRVLHHTTRAGDVFSTPSKGVSPAESRGDSATDQFRSGNAGSRPSDNGNSALSPVNPSEHGNNGADAVADYRPGVATGVSPGTGTTDSRAPTIVLDRTNR